MEAHQGYINSLARCIARASGADVDDLIQEGQIGLGMGLELYDPSHGTAPQTYYSAAIRSGMVKETRTRHAVHIPHYLFSLIRVYLKRKKKLKVDLGYEPSFEQVASGMDLPHERKDCLRAALTASLPTAQVGNWVSVDDRDITSEFEDGVDVAVLLDLLKPRQREVVTRYFGIGGVQNETLKEIGESIGLTRERVRQIRNQAVKIMQAATDHRTEGKS
jgi:RNA polymerase sigma factor (sigma-70 family)